jgi:peptide/nickel transport system permease protein
VLVLISAIVIIPVAFAIAMISANYRGKRTDGVIQVIMITLAGLPEFVVAHPAGGAVLHHRLHLLPAVTIAGGGAPPWSKPASMILPVLTLVIAVARTCPGSCAPACWRCSTATTSSWPGSRACRSGS